MRRIEITELVWVEEAQHPEPPSCRVVIECDDRIGAGLVLEKLVGIDLLRRDWLKVLKEKGFE